MFQVQIGNKFYGATFEHYPPFDGAIAGATFCMIDEINGNFRSTVSYGSFVVRTEDWSKHSKNARRKEALRQALLSCELFDDELRKLFWDAYHDKRGYKGNAQVILSMTDETLYRLNAVANWDGQTKKTALKTIVNDAYNEINGNSKHRGPIAWLRHWWSR